MEVPINHSGALNYRTDPYGALSDGKGPVNPSIDPQADVRIRFDTFRRYLPSHLKDEGPNWRSRVREKLTRLTRAQYQELCTDVYDEVVRRNVDDDRVLFLPVRDDFHPKRNQARQKLATLPRTRFKDLTSDVFFELCRRYPDLQGTDNGSEPATVETSPKEVSHDHPVIVDFTGKVNFLNNTPVSSGGFCDIWKGLVVDRDPSLIVAMKVFRVTSLPEKAKKLFNLEFKAWSVLKHPHILPLLGTCELRGEVYMICPWQNNGNVLEFLKSHQNADKRQLLSQVAKAMQYLHNGGPSRKPMVHGDIKGENVLVDEEGKALLADFGLATLIEDVAVITRTTAELRNAGSIRFMAPELLLGPEVEDVLEFDDDDPSMPTEKTPMSDVYAFGQLIYQVVTGKRPFPHLRSEPKVILQVVKGQQNPRPRSFDDDLWQLCTQCWTYEPSGRPPTADVVTFFEQSSLSTPD